MAAFFTQSKEQIEHRLAAQQRRAARFRRIFGPAFGALLALVFAFITNGLVLLEMPGVPLRQEPLGAAGNILVWALVGACLGLLVAWPEEGLYGVLIGAAVGTLLISAFTFLTAGSLDPEQGRTLTGRLLSLIFAFLPIAGFLFPLALLLRWAINSVGEAYLGSVPYWRVGWIPLLMVVLVAWVGMLARLPAEARVELLQTQELIQDGLQASTREDLPPSLQGKLVGDFLYQAAPEYTLEWDQQNVNRYAIPRSAGSLGNQEAVVVARFSNDWVLACLYTAPGSEPICKGFGGEEGALFFSNRAPSPFEVAWDDYSLFDLNLAQGEPTQDNPLTGATVYHAEVNLPVSGDTLSGRVEAKYTNQEPVPLQEIYLRLYPNLAGGKSQVDKVVVDGQPAQPVYENEDFVLKIPLAQALAPGENLLLGWEFRVTVPAELGGNYGLLSHINDTWALDAFLPTIAVYDERGWNIDPVPPNGDNTYHDAAYYLVQVNAPVEDQLVASGVLVGGELVGETQQAIYALGPGRDFYLAASPYFSLASEHYRGILVNSYAIEELGEANQRALRSAVESLRSFEKHYGSYPYRELDLVSLPMQALGVEYPGVIGLSQELYEQAPGGGGDSSGQVQFYTTIAHEVGHQWFYNLVGNDQSNEPWLDEALAQHTSWQYLVDQYGEGIVANGVVSYWQGCVAQTGTGQTPVGLPAGDYPDGRSYVGAVYCRGPLFIRALAQAMGGEAFDEFLRAYVAEQRWEIATAGEFKALAEATCACDLEGVFADYGIRIDP